MAGSVKHLPNWRGIKGIRFKFNGKWSDPYLIYRGYVFNYWAIEDALWGNFLEDTGHKDSESGLAKVEEEFNIYLEDNAKDYLEDCIFIKCYEGRYYL